MHRTHVLLQHLPRITLYTGGPECSLCEVAKEALHRVGRKEAFELETVNIRESKAGRAAAAELKRWRRLYQYDIPVIHVNGRQVMKHRVDEDGLVGLLGRIKQQTSDD